VKEQIGNGRDSSVEKGIMLSETLKIRDGAVSQGTQADKQRLKRTKAGNSPQSLRKEPALLAP
jgi:hypothetical protein